ncbi:drug resistance transporter, EmrB/QacA subfamily [Enhydrobacter aerosaccus]|uniref:Drug resistance transporter, EmrB/QacA subfamily n=1 Tax=Enhydrobacter aerosaccus TaxID=225324 RepID=A0A1T4LH42_9HYPH|nr:DHA2 family efflux MFS transporter permease subunit [Enhydrobacter aerosaccus]SJZ54109.1 drug resistance transporter, EmrB/QacA subfamily [Enhydrobacter aerosaccus]
MASPGSPAAPSAAADNDRIEPQHLAAFIAMVFGMFMAILDIQIVSASLSEIQAGLSASADEIPWVQTAYLVAEVVMIPLSGLLSRAMGTRILFALSAGGFTLSSLACGLSTSMEEMILWRAVQGFIGGGMIPTVFATAYMVFPRSKFAVVTPVIGLVATLAPTIGPTVGGYLTDLLSWRWLFFINIVPGLCVTTAALALIDFDEPHWALFDDFDWLGLAAMAGFLGSLEYVLEDGPRYGWFEDETVLTLGWVMVLSAVVFFVRAFTVRQPIVDLRTFGNRNFAIGALLAALVGVGLYGMTLIYPLYLGRIRGYNALMIGETVFVSGVAMFLTAPIIGRLMSKVDPRLMIMAGSLIFAVGTWQTSTITSDWDFGELLWPQIFRGVGLMTTMIPIQNVALGTLPLDRVKNAAGLFNLMRNLGGAIGLAGINTVLNDRTDLHLARLHERLTWAHPPALERLDQLTQRLQDYPDAATMALKLLTQITHQQGVVMAFADVFLLLTLIFVALAGLTLLLRRPAAGAAPGGGGH